jgi:hypothetical protein
MPPERRAAVMALYNHQAEDGTWTHAGWPNYVAGILSAAEVAEPSWTLSHSAAA